MNFKNLQQLFDTFKDEQTCREYLVQQRWNGKPVCPFCGHDHVYNIEGGKRYKCGKKECYKKFSVTVGTIYENSKIDLRTWFAAIYLCTSSKKGISSLQLHRQLGITQKTAWFVLHRIREMLREKAPQMLKEQVQIDESYFGGKEANKHKHKRINKGGSQGKTPVLGLLDNNGKVVTYVLPQVTQEIITPLMVDAVEDNTVIVTDAHKAYNLLKERYVHVVIRHDKKEYVKDGFHTNSIEGFWSILKRGIYGIYHQVSPKHLHRYCDEFAGRYNTRKVADNERFKLSVKNSEGRLKYQKLIGK